MVVYKEKLGNGATYEVSQLNSLDFDRQMYYITVSYNGETKTVPNFTANKEKAIEFTECLVRNSVTPVALLDVASDYCAM